ncbi:MAG: cyclic nucleotide-binding domain-containing protein [Proteobacteria bacterium]|nr:cyclic nucleotide-binding domain-containing protein [Pseudomonadota bacterium]MBU1739567.1 cyclic nucleotide-binding domain-containing protein [Pseudomonadota bacterium]
MNDLQKYEESFTDHPRNQENLEEINSLLFKITKYAQQGDIERAESLRDKISVIDPLALSEVIQAQDIIESARSKPSGSGHQGLWKELYGQLTDAESLILYNLLKKSSYKPGQTIYEEGDMDRNLYFLESGQAKHVYTRNGKETFIRKIRGGDIAGEDNVLNASFCTTSLIAMTPAVLHLLNLDRLQEEAPDGTLLKKIREFCVSKDKLHDLLKSNSQDRRRHLRIALEGSILIRHPELQGAKSLRGKLRDVSAGGVSFHIQAGNREMLQMLLGKDLDLKFYLPPHMQEIKRTGRVLSIRDCDPDFAGKGTYSIHMKFAEPLAEHIIVEAARYLRMVKPA